MKKVLSVLAVILCFAAVVSTADASALLVQDVDPWGYTANQDDMTALGISYVMSDYASVPWTGLCSYDFVLLVAGDGNDDPYHNNAVPHLDDLTNYVANGGLLLIHYAPWTWQAGAIAPGGVQSAYLPTEHLDIDAAHTADPLFANVTNASLDNWNFSAHCFFTNLVAGTQTLINYEDGSGPAYVRYSIGAGDVWLTGMTLEWYNADPDVLYNELQMAQRLGGGPCVPEPTALMSLCAGLALLGGYRFRGRK